MSYTPATPRTDRKYSSATPQAATPVTHRTTGGGITQPSPHYTTTRRHSLYGTEDRIVIDPGSRVWKVGFSGEGKPRDVLYAGGKSLDDLWTLDRAPGLTEREEEETLLEARVRERLRSVFHDSLLTDPKSRKILLVEHPLLPLYVKEMLARVLFNNLQVPSISFVPSSLLSLLAVGRITGMVVDCGHLETTALPIFAARPLYPQLRTTPLAGAHLSNHLHALLLLFGTYLPPPTTLSGSVNLPAATRSTRVPQEILTEALIEEIKTRCCLVGTPLDAAADLRLGAASDAGDEGNELDVPSEITPSEPESMELDTESIATSSVFSAVSHPRAAPGSVGRPSRGGDSPNGRLEALAAMYARHSTATDLRMRVVPPSAQQTGTGRGTLVIPGWIRERAAEVLFEGGDVDESSVAETILDSLLKVPMDLRKTLASSIVVAGGTAMLPGFIPRVHAEIVNALTPSPHFARPPGRRGQPPIPVMDRYAPLRPLLPHFAILNNPSPAAAQTSGQSYAGRSPAFAPAALAWVGGSLAGALKIGGVEINRERWDAADPANQEDPDDSLDFIIDGRSTVGSVIPDWTRSPLPAGAPAAPRPPPAIQVSSPSMEVEA